MAKLYLVPIFLEVKAETQETAWEAANKFCQIFRNATIAEPNEIYEIEEA